MNGWPSPAILRALALALGATAVAGAGERPLAYLGGFRPTQTREARFETGREVAATVSGIGAGGRGSLYAYAWLYDLDRHRLRWSMQDAEPEEELGGNLTFREQIDLAPGHYVLYYFAGRRSFSKGMLGLKHMFKNQAEQPERWYASIAVGAGDADALVPPSAEAPESASESQIRLAPLGDSVLRRARFRVTRAADAELLALGEADPGSHALADRSSLVRLESREAVWAMDKEPTEPGGGNGKNRMVRRALRLEPGDYELIAATDSSHSAEEWNALPPYLPGDWGVTLSLPADALTREGLPEERTIARLAGVGDEEHLQATFRLSRPAQVRVYAFAEWSAGHGFLADYGFIEDATSGEKVWKMEYSASEPAGGSGKNRLYDTSVKLPPGTYRVGYETDDSHSYPEWNSGPPDDPRNWGITLSTFDPAAVFELTDLGVAKASEQPKQPGRRR